MSRQRTWYPPVLPPLGLVLVLILGQSAPLWAQGAAPNTPLAPLPDVIASDCTYATHVHVSWTAVPNAAGYIAKRSETVSGPTVTACTTISGTSCDDTTVPPNRAYYYWVEPHFLIAPPGELRGPDAGIRRGMGLGPPTGLDASDGTYTDFVRLIWNALAGTPKYNLRRGESTLGPWVRLQVGIPGDRYDDTTAAPGKLYYYQAQAIDLCDQVSAWGAMEKGYRRVGPLAAPTNVRASDCEYEDRVRITWDAVAFAIKYRVLRAESPGGIRTKLADISGTHYDDDPPELNRTYYYWVRTCSNDTCTIIGDYSQSDKGKKCCDAPPVPANVQASDGAFEDKIVVSWDASAGATSYKVYRAAAPTGTGLLQATVTATTWEDMSATPGTTYYYMVGACSHCGCSELPLADGGYRGTAPPVASYAYLPLVLR